MATVKKLVVEIVDAKGLLPKDGHGTSSPYVVVDFYGQRKRTQTVHRDLNPGWNEVLEFNVGSQSGVFGDMLEIDMYHDRSAGPTRRNNFLGRIRLNSAQFVRKGEEALMYFPLEKKSFFSWIQGEIGLKIYYVNEPVCPPPPPSPPPSTTKEEEQKTEAPVNVPPQVEETEAPANVPPQAEETTTPAAPLSKAEDGNPAAPAETAPAAPEVPEKPAEEEAPTSAPPPENEPQGGEAPPANPPSSDATETHADLPPAETLPPAKNDGITEKHREAPASAVEVMASMMSRGPSDVKTVGGFNMGQPISRQTTTDSFAYWEPSPSNERSSSSYDLVEKMHYLFVKLVKARSLPKSASISPVVKISVSHFHVRSKPAQKNNMFSFEWNQTFAFRRETPESLSTMEVSLWDPPSEENEIFLGGICFDVTEIPVRDPPDSPLAPQWYRLEGGQAHSGDLMLATWIGTQADESFSGAWKTDTPISSHRSKVYLSPKLWYLRATVIEVQDILLPSITEASSFQVKAQLGFQVVKTKVLVSRRDGSSPSWNEDLIFVAAEPLSDHILFSLQNRVGSKGTMVLGVARIPLATIERRVDDRKVASRWFNLEDENKKSSYRGRIHLRLCFDGGYHVMEESAHVCSDFRPTARQLWKPPIGMVELGILGCKNLLPMKTMNEKATTDAYSVAKYGSKWVRTRTISDTLEPKWNEQYTWKVYDPCTVLTIGLFDDGLKEMTGDTRPDLRMGKVRIRLSTLEIGRVYKNTYPLLLLCPPRGLKKMGEIELAVRFVSSVSTLDVSHLYTQPMLPLMHHIKPLGVVQLDSLRDTASKMVAQHLSQSEPPLPREVILYMLDADSHAFSMRKVRANWFRIINVVAGLVDMVKWVDDTRSWKNPTSTLLVHALLVMLVWFPDLIIPTLAFYLFVIGIWNYRFRSNGPSLQHLDTKISQADAIDLDELDEEFDTLPSRRSPDVVRCRYDKLRTLGARVQTVLGDLATQGERLQALVTWRDPRATGIFVGLCFVIALMLYLVPSKMVAMALGFYYLRHPMFRDRKPSPALNFFRRLPSLTDRLM